MRFDTINGRYAAMGQDDEGGGPMTDAQAVRAVRDALGMSRADLGRECGASARTVEGWEHGRRAPSPLVMRWLWELHSAHLRRAKK